MNEREASFKNSPWRWFSVGFMVVMLVLGGANAVSYFVRSEGMGNLLGTRRVRNESIGFPFEVWQNGGTYRGFFVDYPSLLANLCVGAVFAAAFGYLTMRQTEWLNRIASRVELEMDEKAQPFQFSLRAMVVATVVAAVLAALWRSAQSARPEVLGAIYLLGPLVLVATALAPRNIPWQQRVVILVPLAFLLIGAATAIGAALRRPLDFDQVLLGIFVCWTPQSVAGALGLTTVLLIIEARRGDPQPALVDSSTE